jgi:hypothetical protein
MGSFSKASISEAVCSSFDTRVCLHYGDLYTQRILALPSFYRQSSDCTLVKRLFCDAQGRYTTMRCSADAAGILCCGAPFQVSEVGLLA